MPCHGKTNKSDKFEWEEILPDGIIHYPSRPEHKEKQVVILVSFSTSSVRSNTHFICTLLKRMENVHGNRS